MPARTEFRTVFFASLRASVPVLLGYITLGIAFGLMLVSADLPWWLATIMALFVYAGAAQFMAIGLITSGANLFDIGLLTLLLNGRHAVYGLSLLQKYKNTGLRKVYLIFGLTDETYGLLTTISPPPNTNPDSFYVSITALNQLYWVLGCSLGSFIGSMLPFDTKGLDFALTALFIVLLVEQIKTMHRLEPYIAGLFACVVSLFLVSSRDFLLVSLLFSVVFLMLLRPRLDASNLSREE
ncbi:AzlC family ABC transporter permease [Gracilinema caldarium]|uniref:AzlC family protein n=1 Tax=Gracilinema caldarium (strain ATCC 51460 / DSM 7334 / H1) TaxID=744872 RepID=F8EX65_GRAC1|nr:AzlC family ABC transporter permease [Gracilinema caldarium]AEJ18808.1 AzlC family protein [Gracilinema caldarium DSM 7334]